MGKKEDVYALLDAKGVAYETIEHEEVFTIEDMEKIGICSRGNVCKNLFLRNGSGKRHFLVCVQKDKTVDLKQLGALLGSRMSFASAERLRKHLGLTPGAVTPLGVLNDKNAEVEVVIDQDLAGEMPLGVHPCENTATVFLSFADLRRLIEEHGNPITCCKH